MRVIYVLAALVIAAIVLFPPWEVAIIGKDEVIWLPAGYGRPDDREVLSPQQFRERFGYVLKEGGKVLTDEEFNQRYGAPVGQGGEILTNEELNERYGVPPLSDKPILDRTPTGRMIVNRIDYQRLMLHIGTVLLVTGLLALVSRVTPPSPRSDTSPPPNPRNAS